MLKNISIITIISLLVSILGLGRDIIAARYIGVTADYDCFIAAFSVISFFIVLFNQQNIQSWYMADYHKSRLSSENKANQLKIIFARYLIVIVSIFAALLYLFSNQLFSLLYPQLGRSELLLTVQLFHIMLPVMVLNSTLGVFQSYYHSKDRYLYPALGQLLNSLLIFILLFVTNLTVEWLAYTYLIGMISCWIFTLIPIIPNLKSQGSSDGNRSGTLVLFGRYIIAIAVIEQIVQLWYRTCYAQLWDGALSEFGYASKLIFFPIYLIGFSISTAVLPKITSELQNRKLGFYYLSASANLTLLLLVLSSCFIGVFSQQIPHVLFKSKFISSESMSEISKLLSQFSVFITVAGFNIYLARIIHLLKGSKFLLYAVFGCSILQILSTIYLLPVLNAQAIPLMATLWSMILVGVQIRILHYYKIHIISLKDTLMPLLIPILGCFLMASLTINWEPSFLTLFAQGCLCFVITAGLYFKFCFTQNKQLQLN
ncbi:MAG: hypothetical protein KF820_04270 [Candidatus Paracaedibacteraceae bacterium]|nr:hypothetical protein [Candidatus Paracaedibacteraceae bacterium]